MKIFVVTKTNKFDESGFKSTYEVVSAFKCQLNALSEKVKLEMNEDIRLLKCAKCVDCEADFEDETVPDCYKPADEVVDPTCVNELYEYPKHYYEVTEVTVKDME